MKGFAKRRLQWIAALAVATVVAALGYVRWAEELQRFTYLTGWLLFALMVVLTAYNARKKLPFLPLGKSETWLEFHIYAGYFTAVLFLAHVRVRWPTGWFETVLFILYVVVALSGIVGLILTRSLPKRLTARGGEVLFERIPFVRRDLHEKSEALALQSATTQKTPIIAEFYARHLGDYFARHRHFVYHLLEIRSPSTRCSTSSPTSNASSTPTNAQLPSNSATSSARRTASTTSARFSSRCASGSSSTSPPPTA